MARGDDVQAEDEVASNIFEGVYFAVVPSRDLDDALAERIVRQLEDHGATHCPLSSGELHELTHLVSSTSDFPAYHDAVDGLINVVKPSWIEQSILKKRATNPRQFSPDPSLFLSDVVVLCADDIPTGDKDAIVAGVLAMGGQYSAAMTKLVTHVVALSMDNPQCQIITDKRLHCKPVLPHWFDDCLKLGKKISHIPYQLPNPPLLNAADNSPLWHTNATELRGASLFAPNSNVAPTPPSSPRAPSKDRVKLNVFANKAVMLHSDLDLTDRLKGSISEIVTKAGGSVVEKVHEADMFVCQNRGTADFREACDSGKDVGNLNWLYYLINNNTWTSPMRRLLHFPYPKHGVPELKDAKISVSNYTGEARVYLENLVKAAGADFTKSMVPENTHLVTAHLFSEKCTAAREWNINIVNHIWLEESYAKCKMQSLTNPRYTTFPSKTNLGEVVGQTHIDRTVLERKQPASPSKNAHLGQLESIDANVSVSRTPNGKKGRKGRPTKNVQTPAMQHAPSDKENETPSSRGAKDRALNKLHSMAADIALYEKEAKRRGGVIYGGRKVSDPDRVILNGATDGRKRVAAADEDDSSTDGQGTNDDGAEDQGPPKKKKQKSARAREPTLQSSQPSKRIVVTGYQPWSNDSNRERTDRKRLSALGIDVVRAHPGRHVDVLAMPRLMRTANFLVGMASGPAIVHESWFEEIIRLGERVDERDYALEDEEGERKFGVNLEEALDRARQHRLNGGLLKDYAILITEGAKSGFEALSEIIRANGGECMLYKGKEVRIGDNNDKNQKRNSTNHADEDGNAEDMSDNGDAREMYLISDPKDRNLWPKFRSMMHRQGYVPRILQQDWLLKVAFSHDLTEPVSDWEFKED